MVGIRKGYSLSALFLTLNFGISVGAPPRKLVSRGIGGISVQLAARICDKAENDGIFISSVVRKLSAGANVTFEDKGTFKLKGVEDDPILYGVALGD